MDRRIVDESFLGDKCPFDAQHLLNRKKGIGTSRGTTRTLHQNVTDVITIFVQLVVVGW